MYTWFLELFDPSDMTNLDNTHDSCGLEKMEGLLSIFHVELYKHLSINDK
jgi:hypothetical protein